MELLKLSSVKNPKIAHAYALRDRKERDKERLTVLEGYRELSRAMDAGVKLLECFCCPEFYLGSNEGALLERAKGQGAEIFETTPEVLTKLAYRDRPEGLIAVAEAKIHSLADMPAKVDGLYLVAETIEKPGNLGSLLRSADAAGATGVIVCDRRTDIYNPNVIRASTGAIFSMPLAECTSQEAFDWLKTLGIAILSATPHATAVHSDADMTRGVAIAVGAEQYGLSKFWMESSDLNVKIPMLGRMDSLNVATAATILLYEAARQRGWKPS